MDISLSLMKVPEEKEVMTEEEGLVAEQEDLNVFHYFRQGTNI